MAEEGGENHENGGADESHLKSPEKILVTGRHESERERRGQCGWSVGRGPKDHSTCRPDGQTVRGNNWDDEDQMLIDSKKGLKDNVQKRRKSDPVLVMGR